MAKRRKGSQADSAAREESLVPVIEEEERRLALLLADAHATAENLVNEAEAGAGERIAKVRAGLPALKEERRKRRVALFEKEADELREKMSDSTTRLKAAVEAGRREAVSTIVSAVWPVAE